MLNEIDRKLAALEAKFARVLQLKVNCYLIEPYQEIYPPVTMRRVYADVPKFKRIHQALVETARQHDVTIREIDKALAAQRTINEKARLVQLRRQSVDARKQYLHIIESFVAKLNLPSQK